MTEPAPLSTPEALDALVHQFADPLAFFRELVQNAIDAGSAEIDIRIDYHDGTLDIRVDDYGEGMDRQIIDTRLTRLFSSGKEGDQTKIGRFGIGFVSVFALEPDAVVVDTARGGECWRVLFRPDRSFERIALRLPVDGTKIRILKRTERALFEAVQRRAPEVIAHYCRHAEVEIRLDGQPINQPFDLPSPCALRHREDGAEIVVGYAQGEAFAGYYNRGLTLLEQRLPGEIVSFKINSRYLEHTLTRDNVLRDANHDRLIARVRELSDQALPELLFERLEQAVTAPDDAGEPEPLYEVAARQVAAWRRSDSATDWLASGARKQVARRHVARALGGELVSLRRLAELIAAGELYLTAAESPVANALRARGEPPLLCRPGSRLPELARALGGEPREAEAAFCCAPARVGGAEHERLASAVLRHLQRAGIKLAAVHCAALAYPGSQVGERIAILLQRGELTEMAEAVRSPLEPEAEQRELVINTHHPTVERLIRVATREPELAAHVTCKLIALGPAFTPQRDSRLAALALEERWRRSKP